MSTKQNKPKTVDELLTSVKVWTKGAEAKDKYGSPLSVNNPEACRFCLIGAVRRVYGRKSGAAKKKLEAVIRNYELKDSKDSVSIECFNDAGHTTFKDVKRVIRLAGV